MDTELVLELKRCLERYWRTVALLPAERAPYAVGITKLEQRIEQLRAATGLDAEQFVARIQASLRKMYVDVIPMDALKDDEFARIAELMDRAGALFRTGDQQGTLTVLSDLDAYVVEITQTMIQEALPE